MPSGPRLSRVHPLSLPPPSTVEIQGVSVVYPAKENTVTALDRVSLDIAPGEFISLIGPSGCGKTTLLRVIADLEQVTSAVTVCSLAG